MVALITGPVKPLSTARLLCRVRILTHTLSVGAPGLSMCSRFASTQELKFPRRCTHGRQRAGRWGQLHPHAARRVYLSQSNASLAASPAESLHSLRRSYGLLAATASFRPVCNRPCFLESKGV
jgi:hypothetical protein